MVAFSSEDVMKYQTFSNITDIGITLDEVKNAIKKIGKGSSFDGIYPDLLSILPEPLVMSIWTLFKGIFDIYVFQ